MRSTSGSITVGSILKKQKGVLLLVLTASAAALFPAAYASAPTPPCSGPSGLLGLLDRPTISDSSCVVPEGMTVLEAGATAGNLYGAPSGKVDTAPNLELRWGLPGNSEFVWLPPNFQYESVDAGPLGPAATVRGFGPTTVGIKHELGYNQHWQWTAEALATLPSGDSTFGSHGLGVAVSGIISYGSGPLGVSLMAGISSETEPTAAGGQRFQSFNPDLTVTWASTSRLQFYAEVYGQSHSGYAQGWGTDADGGLQYLVTPDFEVDLEEGVRIQGNLGGFSNYTGAGLGLLF
ncbi:MAG: transporter [Steroidobacteraceae bacterium]